MGWNVPNKIDPYFNLKTSVGLDNFLIWRRHQKHLNMPSIIERIRLLFKPKYIFYDGKYRFVYKTLGNKTFLVDEWTDAKNIVEADGSIRDK